MLARSPTSSRRSSSSEEEHMERISVLASKSSGIHDDSCTSESLKQIPLVPGAVKELLPDQVESPQAEAMKVAALNAQLFPAGEAAANQLESPVLPAFSDEKEHVEGQYQQIPTEATGRISPRTRKFLQIPADPVAKVEWRERIKRKFNIRVSLTEISDEELFTIYAVPFVILNGHENVMNPQWFISVQKLCMKSPVEAARKFYKHYLAKDRSNFVVHTNQDRDILRKLPHAILDCVIRLVEMSTTHKITAMSGRYCGFCHRKFSHNAIHCPLYPTFEDRLYKVALDYQCCSGCADSDCNIGREDHHLAFGAEFMCNICKSNEHVLAMCDNPCVWRKWRETINDCYVLAAATRHWEESEFSTIVDAYGPRTVLP